MTTDQEPARNRCMFRRFIGFPRDDPAFIASHFLLRPNCDAVYSIFETEHYNRLSLSGWRANGTADSRMMSSSSSTVTWSICARCWISIVSHASATYTSPPTGSHAPYTCQ
ncbi:hypothetical protein MKK88_26980 [Methylobacterium sp. E-005]|uniref:hypothetical protein n=1 Tax=Methylobacterium sp. E-005 TaxID=2836549 RepID=UPI001FBAF3E7|nr:hypothetical protein [Methylobacterium sp. E-005]MCJ2089603.1 hypothetical protein [Methylobacterium sp. E-005]